MAGQFHTTQWSMVLAAGDERNPRFQQALSELCERYWYPVYAYVRRRGAGADEAQDLAQGFFSTLLERNTLAAADRERGRFRSFLLTALQYYLADQHDRSAAKKRGGGRESLSLDLDGAEERYRLEADPEGTPDRLFERRWALAVLESTHHRLQEEIARSSNPDRSRRLAAYLTGDGDDTSYRDVAAELDMTESAVKVAVHRLRKRFGAMLREEVERTVNDPGETESELRFLLAALES
jgi:RNA polymerase sigma-70 factor (ECF subfamily)